MIRAGILRIMLREFAVILALWLGGWVLFLGGAHSLRASKEAYWQKTMAARPLYRALSAAEKAEARRQFMGLWAVKPGHQPFREGGWRMGAAYAAQVAGAWMRIGWVFVYIAAAALRLVVFLRRRRQGERSSLGEMRVLNIFLVLAALWYLAWAFFVPSLSIAYQRFVLGRYDYLWDSGLDGYQALSRLWPCFILVYLVTAGGRALRRIWGSGKSR